MAEPWKTERRKTELRKGPNIKRLNIEWDRTSKDWTSKVTERQKTERRKTELRIGPNLERLNIEKDQTSKDWTSKKDIQYNSILVVLVSQFPFLFSFSLIGYFLEFFEGGLD
jgi:hypothetical protein